MTVSSKKHNDLNFYLVYSLSVVRRMS